MRTKQTQAQLAELWNALQSTVYRVINTDDGETVMGERIRRVSRSLWLGYDDHNGFYLEPENVAITLPREAI